MNFCFQEQQKQCIARLTVLELNTDGDSKFPLQPGDKVIDRLSLEDALQREYQKLNLRDEEGDKEW